jgi:ribosome-associated protein
MVTPLTSYPWRSKRAAAVEESTPPLMATITRFLPIATAYVIMFLALTKVGGHLEGATLARKIVDLLADRQAEDILLLDIGKVTVFADYFVIASAPTVRQMQALRDAIDSELAKDGISPYGREGESGSGWVLLDLGDVIVHLFGPEERHFYDLEGLYRQATPVVRIQ